MTEWELTDEAIDTKALDIWDRHVDTCPTKAEELRNTLRDIGKHFLIEGRRLERAHLASMCGSDPCVGCSLYDECHGKHPPCFPKMFWEHEMKGYAKGLQERDKLVADSVKWWYTWGDTPLERTQQFEAWLASKGIVRP